MKIKLDSNLRRILIPKCIIEDSHCELRRGNTFYKKSIIEITREETNDLNILGTWETNQYIWSEDDVDWSEIYELTKVEKKKVMIEKEVWQEIKDEILI